MRLNLLMPIPALLMNFVLAGASFPAPCLMRPSHFQLQFPSQGFQWVKGEEVLGKCRALPAKDWLRQPAGSVNVFVYADGPSGSGHYWQITVGMAKKNQSHPSRGLCLVTTTVGWRTLQEWRRGPLAWLHDLDDDGKAELIIWNSFPIRAEESLAGSGLMAWVYRVHSEDSVVLDLNLSRKMAADIAKAYRSLLDSKPLYLGPLRAEAASALEQFVDERCSVPANESR